MKVVTTFLKVKIEEDCIVRVGENKTTNVIISTHSATLENDLTHGHQQSYLQDSSEFIRVSAVCGV